MMPRSQILQLFLSLCFVHLHIIYYHNYYSNSIRIQLYRMQICMPNNSYSYACRQLTIIINYNRDLLTITIHDTTHINSALLTPNRCHSEFMHLYASVTIVNEGSATSYNSCNHSQKLMFLNLCKSKSCTFNKFIYIYSLLAIASYLQ